MTALYNLKLLAPNTFQMAKFGPDFNVEAVYNLSPKGFSYTCDCPANRRSVVTKPCKHKRMMPLMLGAVNTDRFYDPETRMWCEPLGDLARPQAGDLAEREVMPDTVVSEAVPPAPEPELFGSMSPARQDLLETAREVNTQMAAKLAAPSSPIIRRR